MKKITLALLLSAMLASASSFAASTTHQGHMNANMFDKAAALKHSNPMPNLMTVYKKYGNELSLNEEQAAKLKKWSSHNGPIMTNMLKSLKSAEESLHASALSAVSQDEIQGKLDNVMNLRLKIASGKMKCRTNMRKILDTSQWNTVVDIYKNKIM